MWTWLLMLPRVARLGRQVPLQGIRSILDTLEEGKNGKYAGDPLRWRRLTPKEHAEHMIAHTTNLFAGDTSEPHGPHLATRAAFLCETWVRKS
jgi:hypothetical protein